MFRAQGRDCTRLNNWLNALANGSSTFAVAAGIIASNEFFALAGKDPSTFITHTYQDVFLRTPTQSEVNFWLAVYNQNQP